MSLPPLPELLWVNAITLLAAFVQTSSGVGFAMVSVPLLALVDLAYLPAPMLMVSLLLSTMMSAGSRAHTVPAELRMLLPWTLGGVVVGALALRALPMERLGLVFGVLVLAGLAASILAPRVPMRAATLAPAGFASGLMGTVAGLHGPPLAALYGKADPDKARATIALVFTLGYAASLIALFLAGLLDARRAVLGLALAPGTVAGFLAARALRHWIAPPLARGAMLAIASTSAVLLVARSL